MNRSDSQSSIEYNIEYESISSKIKSIEHQKLKILDNCNTLIQSMGGEDLAEAEAVGETIAALILTSYRLGVNLGISPDDMDRRIDAQLSSIGYVESKCSKKDLLILSRKFGNR